MEIRWTEEASSNLEQIYNYIARDNSINAERVINGIFKKVQTLSAHPQLGYTYYSRSGSETRVMIYGHYKIIYLINNSAIEILGIYHGAMNIDRLV